MKLCCAACKYPLCHRNKQRNLAANERQILNKTRERCSDDRNHVKAGVRIKYYEEFDRWQVCEMLQRQARELRAC